MTHLWIPPELQCIMISVGNKVCQRSRSISLTLLVLSLYNFYSSDWWNYNSISWTCSPIIYQDWPLISVSKFQFELKLVKPSKYEVADIMYLFHVFFVPCFLCNVVFLFIHVFVICYRDYSCVLSMSSSWKQKSKNATSLPRWGGSKTCCQSLIGQLLSWNNDFFYNVWQYVVMRCFMFTSCERQLEFVSIFKK